MAGHKEFFPDVPEDIRYYRCFRDVVFECAKQAKPVQEIAEFYFDQRAESDFNASVLLGHMASMKDWEYSKFF
jgi:N-acetylneuraminic acid mutarotase